MTAILNGGYKPYTADPGADAFQRLRVSNVATLGDYQLQYDTHPLYWNEAITNTSGNAAVAHETDESSVTLTVEAEDSIVRQTKLYHRYQPGKSQLILCTFVLGTLTADVTQRIGYFDGNNGLFVEADGTGVNLVKRTYVSGAAVDVAVAQGAWSIDTMNGNGPSGINLDWSKAQILIIDLEWLGVGRVRVGFVIDGQIRYCHEFNHANNVSSVYMSTANLPIRYEISAAAGVVGAHVLKQICSQVSSEGGFTEEGGLQFSANTGTVVKAVTTRVPLLTIRLSATFNGQTNRAVIIPQGVNVAALSKTAVIEVVYGGTLTNANFAAVSANYSIAEKDTAATAITGGIVITSFYVPAAAQGNAAAPGSQSTNILGRLPLSLTIAGVHPTTPFSDNLTIVATTAETPSATNVLASMTWRELR